jgi:hypothetical protein
MDGGSREAYNTSTSSLVDFANTSSGYGYHVRFSIGSWLRSVPNTISIVDVSLLPLQVV